MIIWLASYPRSGNTFLRIILNKVFALKNYSLYNDKSDIAGDERTAEVVGHAQLPDDFDIEQARREEKLYLIKTHDYPDNDEDKVIYLLRDGRESTLSYQKYLKNYGFPETTLLDVIYGTVFFGNWAQHIKAWNVKHRQNALLIKFEAIVSNPLAYIESISQFIGVDPVGGNIPDFSELQSINPTFFRGGKNDSWKQVYTEEQHLAFWMKNYEQMMEYGYHQDVPETLVSGDQVALIRQLSKENSYQLDFLNSHFKKLLDENNREIVGLRQTLVSRDAQVVQQRALLDSRDSHISELQAVVSARDAQVVKQRELIAVKDQRLHANDKRLHANEIELKRLQQEREIHQQLAEAVEQMRRQGSVSMHPFRKYSAYKEMLSVHNRVKKS